MLDGAGRGGVQPGEDLVAPAGIAHGLKEVGHAVMRRALQKLHGLGRRQGGHDVGKRHGSSGRAITGERLALGKGGEKLCSFHRIEGVQLLDPFGGVGASLRVLRR